MRLGITSVGAIIVAFGLALIAVASALLYRIEVLNLPPLTADAILRWLFGPGAFVWLLLVVVVAVVYFARVGSKKESKLVEVPPKVVAPSASEYAKPNKDSANIDRGTPAKNAERAARLIEQMDDEPEPAPERPRRAISDAPPITRDFRLQKIRDALDEMEDNIVDSIVKTVKDTQFDVKLKDNQIQVQPRQVPEKTEPSISPPEED